MKKVTDFARLLERTPHWRELWKGRVMYVSDYRGFPCMCSPTKPDETCLENCRVLNIVIMEKVPGRRAKK